MLKILRRAKDITLYEHVTKVYSTLPTKRGIVRLLQEINQCATSNQSNLLEHSIILLSELGQVLRRPVPRNVFSPWDSEAPAVELASASLPKEGFGFLGWIYVEAFAERPMCLWSLAKDEVSLKFVVADRKLAYSVEVNRDQMVNMTLSGTLETGKWYFIEFYHLGKTAVGNCIVNQVLMP